MRQRVLFAILAASVALSVWLRLSTRQVVTPPPARQVASRRGPEAAAVNAPYKAREIRRNLFEFGDSAPRTAERRIASAPPAAATATETPRPTVKLVGIVNAGSARRAALSSEGQVVMAVAGEVVDGYVVLSIDDQEGVRLRTPEGTEILLTPPR